MIPSKIKIFSKQLSQVSLLGGLILLFNLCLFCSSCDKKQTKEEKVSLRLSWIIEAHAAGYYVALDKGYYANENLDMTIYLGGIDFSPVKMVASGSDDFGSESGGETIILARAEGIPIKAIGVIQPGGAPAIITLKKTGISKPQDLAGKKIAIAYGKPAEYVYRALMKKQDVEVSKIKESVFKFDITTLFRGDIDAFTGFKTNQPFVIKSKGFEPVVIDPETYGVKTYGLTLFTSDKMINEQPQLVKGFVKATLKGWKYAFEHPEEAIAIMLKYTEKLQYNKNIEIEKLKAIAITAEPKKDKLFGEMEESLWKEMHDRMRDYEIVKKDINLSDIFTNQFIEKFE